MRVLAIDPGYAVTGWASFAVDAPVRSFTQALRTLEAFDRIRTSTADSRAARLSHIGLGMRTLVSVYRPALIYVEVPSYHGDYGGNPGRRRGANLLYCSLGAILSRTSGVEVVEVPALTVKKGERHKLLEAVAQTIDLDLPSGPRGGSRDNVLDAIWLGAKAIEDRVGWRALA